MNRTFLKGDSTPRHKPPPNHPWQYPIVSGVTFDKSKAGHEKRLREAAERARKISSDSSK